MAIVAVIVGAIFLMITLSQCISFGGPPPQSHETLAPDKLAEVLQRGTLIVATDPAYPPQSDLIEGARRTAHSRCSSDQYTASELRGYDIDVAVEIATRLGLEACFVTPAWASIVGGSWADQWDISVGSMAITPERLEYLYFTQPYYTTPAALFVHRDNTSYRQPSDLSGQTIGVCSGCTYEAYLNGSLVLPGQSIDFVIDQPIISSYLNDTMAVHDLTLGDGLQLDAVLTAQPTGLSWISVGKPLKQLGKPLFFELLAVAVDKHHRADPIPLVKRVTEIIQQMHTDGTLSELSHKYYGMDLTSNAAEFDLKSLDQFP